MCSRCDKQVIEQGILESDLPMLPHVIVKWSCIVPGCRGGCRALDYNNAPFYFDPAKRRPEGKRGFRGGWFNAATHYYLCSKHTKQAERVIKAMEHRFCAAFFLSKIKEHGQNHKTKGNS